MDSFFKNNISKKLIFISSFLIIICFVFLFLLLPGSELSFRKITDQMFLEDITADTLSLHYTLANPSHYSIDSYPLTLPKYDKKNLIETYSKIENNLAAVSNIDMSFCTQEELYCHILLQDYLTIRKQGFSFTYFEDYFAPSSGIVVNYPVLMAEYTFRTERDVTDYLTLLADTPDYFSSFIEFQKERYQKGHFQATSSLKETMNQCDTIITKDSLNTNSHFLQLSFTEKLASLVVKDILSKEKALKYININNDLLHNTVLPAYQNLKKSLFCLQSEHHPLQGLYQKQKGKEYYQWLVQKQVGTSLPISEMLHKLESDFEKNLMEFETLQKKLFSYTNYESYLLLPFPLSDRNDILKKLQQLSKKDFPSLSAFSDKPIKTTIKSVSECMQDYTSPAFYMIPPIDDIWQNTIYINNSSTPEGLDLFTTLAHEGYPGHLYQTVYFQLYSKEANTPLIRHIMNYEGYVEGWAIYCELYSYDYASGLYSSDAQDFYSLWHKLLVCEKKLQLCILSILDIYLHYYDDSFETAQKTLARYSVINKESVEETRRYILEEPGNYLKYYMGYLLLTDIKEKAESLMGPAFSELSFHEFILNAGPSDFDNLEKKLLQSVSFLRYNPKFYSASSNMDSK